MQEIKILRIGSTWCLGGYILTNPNGHYSFRDKKEWEEKREEFGEVYFRDGKLFYDGPNEYFQTWGEAKKAGEAAGFKIHLPKFTEYVKPNKKHPMFRGKVL